MLRELIHDLTGGLIPERKTPAPRLAARPATPAERQLLQNVRECRDAVRKLKEALERAPARGEDAR